MHPSNHHHQQQKNSPKHQPSHLNTNPQPPKHQTTIDPTTKHKSRHPITDPTLWVCHLWNPRVERMREWEELFRFRVWLPNQDPRPCHHRTTTIGPPHNPTKTHATKPTTHLTHSPQPSRHHCHNHASAALPPSRQIGSKRE